MDIQAKEKNSKMFSVFEKAVKIDMFMGKVFISVN